MVTFIFQFLGGGLQTPGTPTHREGVFLPMLVSNWADFSLSLRLHARAYARIRELARVFASVRAYASLYAHTRVSSCMCVNS